MDKAPRVSVVMPIYNSEHYLDKAIESILNQTFTDFEFIIINDGSTDSSANILAQYQRTDKRVQVFDQENRGLAFSIHRGLELAQGTFIARMDADDISHPERFTTQVSYLDAHPNVGVVATNFCLIDSAGTTTSGPFFQHHLNSIQVEWFLCWGNPIVHPSVLYRAEIVRSCGGYPINYQHYADDYALWLRLVERTNIVVLDDSLLYLRKHEQNVTGNNLRVHIDEVVSVAQATLASRLGYESPTRAIRLTRQLPVNDFVSSSDLQQSMTLLLGIFRHLVKRYDLQKVRSSNINIDLAKRLLRLVELYGSQHRYQSLIAFSRALFLAPRLTVSPVGIRILLQALGNQYITCIPHFSNRVELW